MLTEIIPGLLIDMSKLIYVELEEHKNVAKYALEGRYTHLETRAGEGRNFIKALRDKCSKGEQYVT